MADWIGALRRVLDYAKDPNPDHWRTINGSKVHLDENGNYDGGADGRFNGKHHYGPGWKEQQARRTRTKSVLKNLANNFKASRGVSIDMGPGVGDVKCYQVADDPDKIQIDKGMGLETFIIKGGLRAFIEKMEAAGGKASALPQPSHEITPDPLPKGSGGAARRTKMQTRASRRGRPLGAR